MYKRQKITLATFYDCTDVSVSYNLNLDYGTLEGVKLSSGHASSSTHYLVFGIKLECANISYFRKRVNIEGAWVGGGGCTYLLLALSNLTIDHASLSRQSTVPTPNRDKSNISALITLFPYVANIFFAYLVLSPSCLAARGHHRSPRMGEGRGVHIINARNLD